MLKILRPLSAAALTIALAACGSAETDNATNATTPVVNSMFSIGESTANEMGAAPAGEMAVPPGYDPYAEMSANAAQDQPAPAPTGQ